ncbi:MAG: proline dehydrogenase family protein [Melioribacteraceae bacterium]|nr:proline dehydrogenase family protein [Melioribacteraceae bacterium]
MNIVKTGIVKFVKILPKNLVFVFAKKYIAGTKLQDAVEVVKELNSIGIMATMDVLGEAISNKKEAEDAKNECLEVLENIKTHKLDSNLSIKPTQLGLAIDEDYCYFQLKEIVEKAKSYNNFVRIDMEDSSLTDKTIKLFNRINKDFDNVGIVLQAYLKRTADDVDKLNPQNTDYRLCKGIYVEPEKIAYKDRKKVQDNFIELMSKIISNGNYVGIATHDEVLVDAAYKYVTENKIDKDKFEFQMLYGVREELRNKISADGYRLRVYVPFGEHWYHYSVRRLQENPTLAWYITKSLFTKK